MPFQVRKADLVYRPMWYVRRKIVSAFHVVPVRSGDQKPWNDLLGKNVPIANILDLDLYCLKSAADAVSALTSEGEKALIATSVHFDSVQHGDRRLVYLAGCQCLRPEWSRQLIIEITNLPNNFSRDLLAEIVNHLRRYFRAVLVRMPLRSRRFSELVYTKIFAVGADLATETGPEKETMQEMERFASAAAALGLKSYLHGIDSLSMTTAAVCAGFEYINGDTITSIREGPTQAFPLEPIELYRKVLREKEKLPR